MKQYKLKYRLVIFFSIVSFTMAYGQDCVNCFDDGPSGCGKRGYFDNDGDGYGAGNIMCFYGPNPSNYAKSGGDCNDNNANIYPRKFYIDNDGDGYGTGFITLICQSSSTPPAGYAINNEDCDDTDSTITIERVWFQDSDNDGFGDPNVTHLGCSAIGLTNPVVVGGDLDDTNAAITNIPPSTFYYDADGDDYGVDSNTEYRSEPSSAFYVPNGGDCNDGDANIHPATIWYLDADGDGLGGKIPIVQCNMPTGGTYVLVSGDLCPNDIGPAGNNGCPPNDLTAEPYNTVLTYTYNASGEGTSKSKTYYNDLGKLLQTQNLDIKTGKVWANEIKYDDAGRPAVQTLSAPINSQGHIFFDNAFMRKTDGSNYTTSDFETTPEAPAQVGTTANTLGWFYSEQNTNAAGEGNDYQDITDYPFSRTIYSKLNPGSVLKTIGGNKVDADNDGTKEWIQGHAFSMPAGDELAQAGAFNDPSYKTSDGSRKIIKSISRDVHGNEVVAFSDTDGKALAAARTGGAAVRNQTVNISKQGFVDIHVPVGTTGFTVNGVSGIITEVHDLINETLVTAATNTLANGFYRVSVTNLEDYDPISPATTISISCKENYYDYSLNSYDDVGRLISSKQPLNHLETTFQYNTLGQLVSTTSPDEGTANFKYREDGQIRFSQNSKQADPNDDGNVSDAEFSYTNYDDLGRPIESGVVESTAFATADPDVVTLPSGTKKEQQFTTYDYLESADLAILTGVHSSYSNPTFLASNVAKTSNENTTTYYSYDVYDRVKWVVQNITGLGFKTINYTYDQITGAVTSVDYQKNNQGERFIHRYTYNIVNELVKVETSTDGVAYITHAEYSYYENGALKRLNIAEDLQGLDYVYNLNGQLKGINHPSLTAAKDPGGDNNDLFGLAIDYHKNDYKRPLSNVETTTFGKDQFNGNIKGLRWNNGYRSFGVGEETTYDYRYNKNNWLTDAYFGKYSTPVPTTANPHETSTAVTSSGSSLAIEATESITLLPGFHAQNGSVFSTTIIDVDGFLSNNGDYDVTNIEYDANGNIEKLKRNANTVSGINAMDNFTYHYKSGKNQLDYVSDTVENSAITTDLEGQAPGNYVYNSIGQLIEDHEFATIADPTNIIRYKYNTSGLVTEVSKKNVPLVKFFYNDKGHRVRKDIYGTTGSLTKSDYYIRDAAGTILAVYQGNMVKEHTIYGASRLGVYYRSAATPEEASVYQITDHLGNVRVLVGKVAGGAQDLKGATDYYPFGMVMNTQLVDANGYRYAYQGQEKDPETGKEAFQLRLWDSRIGRWLTTDPAGQYSSPYLGMGNNPITHVDPDGGEDNPIYGSDGTFRGVDEYGLQGEAIVYDGEFTNGMAQSDILSNGGSFLSNWMSSDSYSGTAFAKIYAHMLTLPSRPDWDGIVTVGEADKWRKEGNGQPLFVDISKMNFKSSRLGVDDFGGKNEMSVNFFKYFDIHADNPNILYRPARDNTLSGVYGTLRVVLLDPQKGIVTLKSRSNGGIDTYDFKSWRKWIKGAGDDFSFYGYGSGTINMKYIPRPRGISPPGVD